MLPTGCQLLLQQLDANTTSHAKGPTTNISNFKSCADSLITASSLSKALSSSSSSTCLQAVEHVQAAAGTASSAAPPDNTENQGDTAVVQRCPQPGLASTDLQELTAMLVTLPGQTDAHKLNSISEHKQ